MSNHREDLCLQRADRYYGAAARARSEGNMKQALHYTELAKKWDARAKKAPLPKGFKPRDVKRRTYTEEQCRWRAEQHYDAAEEAARDGNPAEVERRTRLGDEWTRRANEEGGWDGKRRHHQHGERINLKFDEPVDVVYFRGHMTLEEAYNAMDDGERATEVHHTYAVWAMAVNEDGVRRNQFQEAKNPGPGRGRSPVTRVTVEYDY